MSSLKHDHAVATATSILEVFEPCLRDEEKRDAFVEIYERIKACLECYDQHADRMRNLLKPSSN